MKKRLKNKKDYNHFWTPDTSVFPPGMEPTTFRHGGEIPSPLDGLKQAVQRSREQGYLDPLNTPNPPTPSATGALDTPWIDPIDLIAGLGAGKLAFRSPKKLTKLQKARELEKKLENESTELDTYGTLVERVDDKAMLNTIKKYPNRYLHTTDNFGVMKSGKEGLGRPTTQEDIYQSFKNKRGGLVKKYFGGGPMNQKPVENISNGGFNPYMQGLSMLGSLVPGETNETNEGDTEYFNSMNKNRALANQGANAVASVFPIVAPIKALAQKTSNMIAPKDKYGVKSGSDLAVGVSDIFDPLDRDSSAFTNLQKGNIGQAAIQSLPFVGGIFANNQAERERTRLKEGEKSQELYQDLVESGGSYAKGGVLDSPVQIIVEKDEIRVSPEGEILQDYKNFKPHNKGGKDPKSNYTFGNTNDIIIPKTKNVNVDSKTYREMSHDKIYKNTALANLKKYSMDKEAVENKAMYAKYGGVLKKYAKMCAKGGKIGKYFGGGFPRYSDKLDLNPDLQRGQSFGKDWTPGFDLNNSFYTPEAASQRLVDNNYGSYNTGDTGAGSKFPWGKIGSAAGEFALNSAGDIYNLLHYKRPENVNYGQAQYSLLDPKDELSDIDIQGRIRDKAIASASGGNSGSYLSNRLSGSTQNTLNKSRVRTHYNNLNSGIKNQFSQFNKTVEMKQMDDQARNNAAYENMKGQSIGNLGKNAANAWKGSNYQTKDEQMYEYLKALYPNMFK